MYRHDAVSIVCASFFKGQNSIAERVSAMFTRNEDGNYEAPRPMVALACTAVRISPTIICTIFIFFGSCKVHLTIIPPVNTSRQTLIAPDAKTFTTYI
jgi:hypothetical protein